jgi:hypothetical protein
MRHLPCSSSQFVGARFVWTGQLSRWITNRFWCIALPRGKIACSCEINAFITKWLLLILVSCGSLSRTRTPCGFHMTVNMIVLLWISRLGFASMSSLDRVYMRRRDGFKRKHDSSLVTRWCQLSRSAARKMATSLLHTPFSFAQIMRQQMRHSM